MKRDDVGVAFHDYGDACAREGAFGLVEAVEHVRLVEQGSLLRVQVFRLPASYHAPAKCDAFALRVVDGKHHAIEEPVAKFPPVTGKGDVRGDHFLGAEPGC